MELFDNREVLPLKVQAIVSREIGMGAGLASPLARASLSLVKCRRVSLTCFISAFSLAERDTAAHSRVVRKHKHR